MTVKDQQVLFSETLEALGLPVVVPSSVFLALLNQIQYEFVDELAAASRSKGEPVDAVKILIIRDLDIDTTSPDLEITGDYKYDIVSLPSNYRNILSYTCRLHYYRRGIQYVHDTGLENDEVGVRVPTVPYDTLTQFGRIAESEEVFRLLEDPFNRSTFKRPLGSITQSGLVVYTDATFIVSKVSLTYLKNPDILTLETESTTPFPDYIQRMLVEKAALMYVRNNQLPTPPTTQT